MEVTLSELPMSKDSCNRHSSTNVEANSHILQIPNDAGYNSNSRRIKPELENFDTPPAFTSGKEERSSADNQGEYSSRIHSPRCKKRRKGAQGKAQSPNQHQKSQASHRSVTPPPTHKAVEQAKAKLEEARSRLGLSHILSSLSSSVANRQPPRIREICYQ